MGRTQFDHQFFLRNRSKQNDRMTANNVAGIESNGRRFPQVERPFAEIATRGNRSPFFPVQATKTETILTTNSQNHAEKGKFVFFAMVWKLNQNESKIFTFLGRLLVSSSLADCRFLSSPPAGAVVRFLAFSSYSSWWDDLRFLLPLPLAAEGGSSRRADDLLVVEVLGRTFFTGVES